MHGAFPASEVVHCGPGVSRRHGDLEKKGTLFSLPPFRCHGGSHPLPPLLRQRSVGDRLDWGLLEFSLRSAVHSSFLVKPPVVNLNDVFVSVEEGGPLVCGFILSQHGVRVVSGPQFPF